MDTLSFIWGIIILLLRKWNLGQEDYKSCFIDADRGHALFKISLTSPCFPIIFYTGLDVLVYLKISGPQNCKITRDVDVFSLSSKRRELNLVIQQRRL
jgi:hypothetical protein